MEDSVELGAEVEVGKLVPPQAARTNIDTMARVPVVKTRLLIIGFFPFNNGGFYPVVTWESV